MQNQIVCSGCRTVLLYPVGASNVCCLVCNVMTPVPSSEMEMSQFICGGCHTVLTHAWGATSVRCSCCHAMNLVPAIQSAPTENGTTPFPLGGVQTLPSMPYPSRATAYPQNETVVVQNPMTVDENGKLVRNVVVGITT